jgi:RNA polymerase sigma factor (TIGR02999 family)
MELSEQLAAWQAGDASAGDALCRELEAELRVIAAARLRQERHSSLSTGDLVNEAILKLFNHSAIPFKDRAHILAVTSTLMRQILIDQARRRNSDKRQHEAITLSTNLPDWQSPVDLMDVHVALEELAALDPQRARITEMRFFGGMTNAEVAAVLDLSEATIKLRWAATRAWLHDRLKQGYASR